MKRKIYSSNLLCFVTYLSRSVKVQHPFCQCERLGLCCELREA